MRANRFVSRTFIIVVFLFFLIPSFTLNVSAKLVLEESYEPDVEVTWGDISLFYDNIYHNTSALWEEIDNFNAITPDLIDVEVIGQSFFGKDIKSVRITNELITHQKAKTLVVANHHGREQISVEMSLQFILYLLTHYGVDSLVTEYINTQEIYIIPTINPDALDLVVNEHNHMLRKNARPFDDDGDGAEDEDPYDDLNGDGIISWFVVYERSGVDLIYLYHYYEGNDNDGDGLINEDTVGYIDLNRNYDSYFRAEPVWGWSDDSLAGNYAGVLAFSEPETQTYRDFALQHRFAMAYSLHSGTNATYFAKDSHSYFESDIASAMMTDYSDMLPESCHFNDYFQGAPGEDPYYIGGIWDNWMYFERNTLMPISLELYGNYSARFEIGGAEIPIIENSTHVTTEWKGINNFYDPEEQYINALWDDWQPAFTYLLENTPRLAVDATLYSEDDTSGSWVNISFTCTNLSPKLPSITTVDVFDDGGTKIEDGEVILADSTAFIDALFTLPSDFEETYIYKIKIGNEYVGYYPYTFRVLLDDPTDSTLDSFSTIGVVMVIMGTSFFVLKRKRK